MTNIKAALQNLIDRLEYIRQKPGTASFNGINVFYCWENEFAEAKKALEEEARTEKTVRDIDLFDRPFKNEFDE